MKSSLLLIPIALLCSLLLLTVDIIPAFADVTLTVITPTGGGITATEDCTDISAGNDVVWLNCSSTQKLWAISDSTNVVLANITTSGALNQLMASFADTSRVFLNDPTANTVTGYLYSGGLITQTGIWAAPCNIDALPFNYDNAGFLWNTCSTTDQIVRLNPQTMTTDTLASTGVTCVTPDYVSYSTTGNMGVVHCTNGASPDTILTFNRAGSTSITGLDTVTTTSGTAAVMIDGMHSTILAPSSTVMSVWTYTSGGILTLSQTLTGNTFDRCMIEPFNLSSPTQLLYALCEASVNPNALVTGFMINSTGVFQVMNSAVTFADSNSIGLDIHDGSSSLPVWYVASSTTSSYIRIDGVRTLTGTEPTPPEPPSGGGGGTGGVDCTLAENAQKLICRLSDNPNCTNALGCGGDFIIGNTTGGTGIIPIFCGIGIIDCEENPDMKTNGAGLILTFIALAVMVGILWVASRGDLGSVPMFIWIIGTLIIVGFATLANLIDASILIISVVIIIALATAKLRGLFGGEFK